MKKVKKEIDKIKEEIGKLDKPADKDAQEEQSNNNKKQKPHRQSDESDNEKERGATDKKKNREKRLKLNLDLRNAKLDVEKIKEVMDEPKTYGDLPENTRKNMIRKIYVSGGKYTVEVKSGKESHSVALQVGSAGSGSRGRSRSQTGEQSE